MRIVFTNSSFLNIEGTGIAHVSRICGHAGHLDCRLQQFGSSVGFSASAIVNATNVPTIFWRLDDQWKCLEMSWNAIPGQPYQLQTTPDLNQAAWSNVGTITTTNPTTSSYSVGPEPGRFFRVAVSPQ